MTETTNEERSFWLRIRENPDVLSLRRGDGHHYYVGVGNFDDGGFFNVPGLDGLVMEVREDDTAFVNALPLFAKRIALAEWFDRRDQPGCKALTSKLNMTLGRLIEDEELFMNDVGVLREVLEHWFCIMELDEVPANLDVRLEAARPVWEVDGD